MKNDVITRPCPCPCPCLCPVPVPVTRARARAPCLVSVPVHEPCAFPGSDKMVSVSKQLAGNDSWQQKAKGVVRVAQIALRPLLFTVGRA